MQSSGCFVGLISAALSIVSGLPSYPEQRLVIEPNILQLKKSCVTEMTSYLIRINIKYLGPH